MGEVDIQQWIQERHRVEQGGGNDDLSLSSEMSNQNLLLQQGLSQQPQRGAHTTGAMSSLSFATSATGTVDTPTIQHIDNNNQSNDAIFNSLLAMSPIPAASLNMKMAAASTCKTTGASKKRASNHFKPKKPLPIRKKKLKKAPGALRRFKSAFIFFSTWKHKEINDRAAKQRKDEVRGEKGKVRAYYVAVVDVDIESFLHHLYFAFR